MNEKKKQEKHTFTKVIEVEGQTSEITAVLTYNYTNDTYKITTALTTNQCSASDTEKNERTVNDLGDLISAAIIKGLQLREASLAAREGSAGTGNLFEQGGRPENTADDLPI